MSTNLLRNRVLSLIDASSPKSELLKLLAIAMCDPEVRIIADQHGWKVASNDQAGSSLISEKGETLVINQNQLKEIGLATESLTSNEFKKRFAFRETESEKAPQSAEVTLSTLQMNPDQWMEKLKAHIKYNPHGT